MPDNANCSFQEVVACLPTPGKSVGKRRFYMDDLIPLFLRSISIRDATAREVHERDSDTKQKSHGLMPCRPHSRDSRVISDTFDHGTGSTLTFFPRNDQTNTKLKDYDTDPRFENCDRYLMILKLCNN